MGNSNKIQVSEIIVIALIWFAAWARLDFAAYQRVALYVAIPLAFILSFIKYGIKVLQQNVYIKLLFILYLWIVFSALWAFDLNIAFVDIKRILGVVLLGYIVTSQGTNYKTIPYLYITYFILLSFDWYYAYNNILTVIHVDNQRMDDEVLDGNMLAYHTFYVTFAIYIFVELLKGKGKTIAKIAFWFTIPLSVITAVYTASRQILIIQVPLILSLLYIRYMWKQSFVKRIGLLVVITICFVTLIIPQIERMYEGSILQQRTQDESISEDPRTRHIKRALNIGMEFFPLGVGPGNYAVYTGRGSFSHNAYTELFANEGPVGLILYLSLLLTFISRQYKRYKTTKDRNFLVFLLFGILYFIEGMLYVLYVDLWLTGIFMLVATHSETYYCNKYVEQKQINKQ
jgi:O-antigen ligase